MSIPVSLSVAVQNALQALLAADTEITDADYLVSVANDPSMFPVNVGQAGRIDLCCVAVHENIENLRSRGANAELFVTMLVRRQLDVMADVAVQDAVPDAVKNVEQHASRLMQASNRGVAVSGYGRIYYDGREMAYQVADLKRSKVAVILTTLRFKCMVEVQ
jgi:hypothetical protein